MPRIAIVGLACSTFPGNNMKPYGGLASAEDRTKLIAFLQSPTPD
jgi:cytochrome c2